MFDRGRYRARSSMAAGTSDREVASSGRHRRTLEDCVLRGTSGTVRLCGRIVAFRSGQRPSVHPFPHPMRLVRSVRLGRTPVELLPQPARLSIEGWSGGGVFILTLTPRVHRPLELGRIRHGAIVLRAISMAKVVFVRKHIRGAAFSGTQLAELRRRSSAAARCSSLYRSI